MQGVSERDWKLFKERLPVWQKKTYEALKRGIYQNSFGREKRS